ncbi:MAG: flagellar hook-associated protein FlgK [Fibrobacteria bacterium]|nr:flagellar hook-associated protein FlgK [Fibrobacteria bacterium]
MSLMEALNIGSRGLAASQTALNIVGQNVTNANTEGYTRKRLDLQAAVRADGDFGQMGFGVEMVDIRAMRDQLLDKQIQEVKSDVGEAEVRDATLMKLQDIFSEPGDTSISAALDGFWNAWQDLANNPSNLTARQAVLDTASTLSGRFVSMGEQLTALRIDKNDEIATRVGEANQLLDEIDKINRTIAAAELGDLRTRANDSRDARELKLKELSKLLDVSYTEDNQGRYIITTGGSLLLSGEGVFPIKLDRDTVALPDGTQYAQVSLRLGSTNKPFEPKGGALYGLVETRDEIVPRYQGKLDALALSLVQAVNAAHETGYDLQGRTGTSFFDPRITGASDMRLFAAVLDTPEAVAAGIGGTTTSPGAPIPSVVPPVGTDLDLSAVDPNYRNLLEGSVIVRTVGPPAMLLAEGAGKDYVVDSQNGRIQFTNAALAVPGAAITVDFRYNTAGSNGKGDGANALQIAQMRQKLLANPDRLGELTATLGDSWASTVGDLGAESRRATEGVSTLKQLESTLVEQAQSLSGVSIDEELADMVRFQHSYQASARFLSTVSELLQSLINIG